MTGWAVGLAATGAAAVGVAAGQLLVARGLAQLGQPSTRSAGRAGRAAAALGGAGSVLLVCHVDSWWLLPAALVWAYTLASAATCDKLTQRIPTPLVRQGGLATAALLGLAAVATGHGWWAASAAISATVAGVVVLIGWRFAGAGFGDVRLAVLGGLGLVAPTHRGLLAAVGVFVLITFAQASFVLLRGGTRRSTLPFGPAIAIACAIAATL